MPTAEHDDYGAWLFWHQSLETPAGLRSPTDFPMVEVRPSGDAKTWAINPSALPPSLNVDQLLWRPMLWSHEAAAERRLYSKVEPEAVVRGVDGFLFLRMFSLFEQMFEGAGLSDKGAARWVDMLEQRCRWCEERGAEYRFFPCPEVLSVYNDKIPGAPGLAENRPVKRIIAAANDKLRRAIIYPQDELIRGRERFPPFSPTDVHFTSYGAFICYRALMQSLKIIPPDSILREDQLGHRKGKTTGGLGRLVGGEEHEVDLFSPPQIGIRTLLREPATGQSNIQVIETEFSDAPTLVLFGSSNAQIMKHFFYRHFSRIINVAHPWFMRDLIESERPDVVISETPERYISPNAAMPGHDPDAGNVDHAHHTVGNAYNVSLPLPRKGLRLAGTARTP